MHAFNPALGKHGHKSLEFQAILVYRLSSICLNGIFVVTHGSLCFLSELKLLILKSIKVLPPHLSDFSSQRD